MTIGFGAAFAKYGSADAIGKAIGGSDRANPTMPWRYVAE